MSDLFGVPLQNGGLMGLMTDPQSAGLLGLAGGLLQASGASRLPVSNGQALGMGLQGMQQGTVNALNTQRQMLQMRAMQGLMGLGDGAQAGQSSVAPSAPSYSSLFGTSTPTAAQMPPASSAPAASGAMAPAGQSTIFGRPLQQLWNQGLLMNMAGIQGGSELMSEAAKYDPALAMQMPTDAQRMAAAAYGYGTPAYQAAIQNQVEKAGYIEPVNARPGSILRNPLTMQPMAFNPNIPQGGTPVFDASGNVVGISTIPGAAGVASTMSAAKTAGEGSALPFTEGRDAAGNPLPIMSRTQAATGNLPLPLRNNNPGAVSPNGQVASYPDLQTGLKAMDDNLAAYASDPQVKTLGDAITKWVGSPANAPAYIKDVTTRLGIPANQPVDLSNPAVRQAVGTAIMLHENGPAAVFKSAPAAQGGAIYAQPPMGAKTAAEASQGAPSKQMADSQDALASQDANYQQSRASLLKMLSITQNGGLGDSVARLLPENLATRLSNDAAEYQKAHANYVSLQGKALGAGGTDASRAMLDEAVPTFDKPSDARISGLTDQLNQLDLAHLKRQTLTPIYQQGNEKAYTDLSAQFDKSVTPAMMPKLMPILNMPASPARTQALRQAIQDPQMKAALDLMVKTGQLK